MIRTAVIAASLPSRAGLKAILETDETIDIVTDAVSLSDLAAFPASLDVVIVMAYPDETLEWEGIAPSGNLPAILLISDTADHLTSLRKIQPPAWGTLPTEFSEAELFAALYAIETGLIAIAPSQYDLLETPMLANPGNPKDREISLTTRELEVLILLSDGLANKQISSKLGISEHTVKFHVSSIYQKLNVSNRAEAVRMGIQLGLIMV